MPSATRARPLAAADRLVVHPAVATDKDVVHRPLRRGADPVRAAACGERAQAHVGDALAHLDVAGADRGRERRGDDRSRRARSHARDATRRRWRGWSDPATERSANDDALTVTASTALTLPRPCASVPVKSNVIVVAIDRDRDNDASGLLVGPAPVESIDVVDRPRAVGHRAEGGAHAPLAVVDDLVERRAGRRAASRSTPTRSRRPARRDRRPAPPASASWRRTTARTPSLNSTGGMRSPSCWISVASAGIEPGRGAADVGMVGPIRSPSDEAAVDEARRHERDVVQVRATGERIVEDHLIARAASCVAERVDGRRAPTPASNRGGPGCARPARAARRRR